MQSRTWSEREELLVGEGGVAGGWEGGDSTAPCQDAAGVQHSAGLKCKCNVPSELSGRRPRVLSDFLLEEGGRRKGEGKRASGYHGQDLWLRKPLALQMANGAGD